MRLQLRPLPPAFVLLASLLLPTFCWAKATDDTDTSSRPMPCCECVEDEDSSTTKRGGYDGEPAQKHADLDLEALDFSTVHAVVVTGVTPCGHMLLHVGNWYFHIAKIRDVPFVMDEAGYQKYLREHKKHEERRDPVPLKKPDGAKEKLRTLLPEKWTWVVIPHNCVSFVEAVIQAGGSKAGRILNCPRLKT